MLKLGLGECIFGVQSMLGSCSIGVPKLLSTKSYKNRGSIRLKVSSIPERGKWGGGRKEQTLLVLCASSCEYGKARRESRKCERERERETERERERERKKEREPSRSD